MTEASDRARSDRLSAQLKSLLEGSNAKQLFNPLRYGDMTCDTKEWMNYHVMADFLKAYDAMIAGLQNMGPIYSHEILADKHRPDVFHVVSKFDLRDPIKIGPIEWNEDRPGEFWWKEPL